MQADKAKDAKGGKTEAKEPAKEPAKEDPKAKLPGNPLGTTSDVSPQLFDDDSGEIEVICSPIPYLLLVLTCTKLSIYIYIYSF